MKSEDQEPFVLGSTMLRRLRKRHSIAGKSATRSTLNNDPRHARRQRDLENDGWQSDTETVTTINSSESSHHNTRTARTRRYSSVRRSEAQLSSPTKRTLRSAPVGTTQPVKDDQRWIDLLERNNEELLSQIETLTSDANVTEKTLKTQLQMALAEISSLKEQLSEKDRAAKFLHEQNESRFKFLRSVHVDQQQTHVEGSGSRLRSSRMSQQLSDQEVKKLLQEKDLLRMQAKANEMELLRYKRRNADLAEQILHKRGLEMTVEGQNRYLLELSSALEENRRSSMSESAESPTMQQLGAFLDTPILSPVLPNGTQLNRRPVSFDGTQWAFLAHARNQSLMDLHVPTSRPQTAMSMPPDTPPLTDRGDSPLKDVMCLIGDTEKENFDCRHDPRQPSTLEERMSQARARPTLRRNESSLWVELYNESVDKAIVSTEGSDRTMIDHKKPNESVTQVLMPSSRDLKSYVVHFQRNTMSNGLHILFCGWTWLCFLSLLAVAVMRVVRDGPDSIGGVAREPRERLRKIFKSN